MRILLTGTRHFAALSVARQLHREGHVVYAADSIDFDYTGFSWAVKKRFEMPSVRFAEQKYIEKLARIIVEYKIDKVVPLSEEIYYIARNMGRVLAARSGMEVEADDIGKLEMLHNKETFFGLVKKLGLKIPPTVIVSSVEEIVTYQKKKNRDVVVKPVYSRFASRLLHFKNVKATRDFFAGGELAERYVVQDFIEGEDVSSFSVCGAREVITYHSDVEMRKPGAMGMVVRIETPEIIRDVDRKIREALGFEYQLGLDFIRTAGGEWFLLEANPRATIGRMLERRKHAQFRIMGLHQFLNRLVAKGSRLRFLRNFVFYPDAISRFRDPLPALASQIGCVGLGSYLRFCKLHPGVSFQAYSTFDMEYNGGAINVRVAEACDADGGEVLGLLEGLATKRSFSIAQTRRPDPVKSFLTDGKKVSVALVKSCGEVAYLGVCAENDFYVSGAVQPVGYVSAVRKNPEFLYQINWRDALYGYFRKRHARVEKFVFAVMSDNAHATRALTRATKMMPAARLVCEYKTFIVNALRFRRRELPEGLSFGRLHENDMDEAVRFLRSEGRRYDFFPEITSLRDNFLGATMKNSFVMKRDGVIVGFAAILDQTQKKQFFVKKYAGWMRAMKMPFNMVSRPLRLITMPDENSTIDCPTVSLCVVRGNDVELYDLLLCRLAAEVRKRSNIFTVSMAVGNPCLGTLASWWNLSVDYNLYVTDYAEGSEEFRDVYVDGAVF